VSLEVQFEPRREIAVIFTKVERTDDGQPCVTRYNGTIGRDEKGEVIFNPPFSPTIPFTIEVLTALLGAMEKARDCGSV
jgi:hypothetical protein